jgi:hypothetical protein
MKTTEKTNQLIIDLTANELWSLSKLFAPGLIFGVEDPTQGMTDEEIQAAEAEVYTTLNQAGVLEMEASGQLRIDEMLGAMVYSTIHSTDMLTLKTPGGGAARYYHFLPEWQLELCQAEDGYQLTLFKERADLLPHILDISKTKLHAGDSVSSFVISERDLELAAFLYESGKKERALEVMSGDKSQQSQMEIFLQDYLAPELHLVFDMLYDRDDEDKMHSRRNELLQTSEGLFWLSHDLAGEEALPIIHVNPITPEEVQARFGLMLPADKV